MNSDQVQLLIDLIQHYPFLYDKSRKDFKDNNKKNDAWDSIAMALSISVDDAQRSWKNLREKYGKERKRVHNITSESEAPACQWPLYKHMDFMKKHIASRRRASNVSRPVSESPTDDVRNVWGSVKCVLSKDQTLNESDESRDTTEEPETQDFSDKGPIPKKFKATTSETLPSTSGTKTSESKLVSITEDTLGVLTSYLHEKKKPDKNSAFGDYVGLTLSEMPIREQNYKKLKIVEILNETFQD